MWEEDWQKKIMKIFLLWWSISSSFVMTLKWFVWYEILLMFAVEYFGKSSSKWGGNVIRIFLGSLYDCFVIPSRIYLLIWESSKCDSFTCPKWICLKIYLLLSKMCHCRSTPSQISTPFSSDLEKGLNFPFALPSTDPFPNIKMVYSLKSDWSPNRYGVR